MLLTIEQLLKKSPFELNDSSLIAQITAIVFVLLIAIIVYIIAKYLIVRSVHKLIGKTDSSIDDILVKRNLFGRIALLAPAAAMKLLARSSSLLV